MNHYAKIWAQAIAFALIACSAQLPAKESWHPPNMEKVIFAGDKIRLGENATLDAMNRPGFVAVLVAVAKDFNEKEHGVDYKLRAHALALAGRISPENGKFENVLDDLNSKGTTDAREDAQKRQTADGIYKRGIEKLMLDKSNKDNLKCAAYAVDIALRLMGDNKHGDQLKAVSAELDREGIKVDWNGMLGAATPHKRAPWDEPPLEFEMSGGAAEGFKRNGSSGLHGLVVQVLRDGSFAGDCPWVNAKASQDKDLAGLIFTFKQEVGWQMRDSLDNVVDFLEGRYKNDQEKVPRGFSIELFFPENFHPKDGPSAGVVFALILDTLFTGKAIDPAFAATGAMTQEGRVHKVGGLDVKVRAAIKANMKIVGIPEDNNPGITTLKLDDPNLLLKGTQIFTLRNFDEAFELSLLEKSSKVLKVIADFEEIVADVREDRSSLRTPEIQKRLEDIIDPVKGMPNHLSAKFLLDFGRDRPSHRLSALNSWVVLNGLAAQLDPGANDGDLPDDEVQNDASQVVSGLKDIAEQIDPSFSDYHKTIDALATVLQKGVLPEESPEGFTKRLCGALRRMQHIRAMLADDPDIHQ